MKRLKKVGITLLILVVIVVLAALVVRFVIDASASQQLEKKIAELKARGKPVTMREIEPPDVPDDENAALLFNAAFAILGDAHSDEENKVNEWWVRQDPKDFTEEIEAAMSTVVNRYSEAIRLVTEGVRRPKCKFSLEWEKGTAMLLPHLGKFRRMAGVLRTKAFLEFQKGFRDEAVATCVVGIRLADALEDEPMLVSQLVRYSALGISLDVLDKALKSGEASTESYRQVMNALKEFELIHAFRKAIEGERCIGMQAFNQLLAREEAIPEMPMMEEVGILSDILHWFCQPLLKLDKVAYIDLLDRLDRRIQHFIEEPSDESIITQMIEKELEDLPFYCYCTRLLVPGLLGACDRMRQVIVRRDLTRLACALKLHKMQAGSYPESIDGLARDIIEEIPKDPFDGESYRYEVRQKGFIIYSVGPDRKDDGGKAFDRVSEKGDIVWECE